MATQKKKRTQRKRDQRRAHWKVTLTETTACPSCGMIIQPYHVCPSCGQYRGKQVLALKKEDTPQKK